MILFWTASLIPVVLGWPKPLECSTTLASILFQPNTLSREYLERIGEYFRFGSALLFTAQASAYVSQFEQEWGVSVSISVPSNVCGHKCITFGETGIATSIAASNAIQLLYTFPQPIPYPISSLKMSLLSGYRAQGTGPFFSASLAGPDGSFNKLLNQTDCTSAAFQCSLSDSSAEPLTNDTCPALNLTPPFQFAPVKPFSAAYVGKALLYDTWGLTIVNLQGTEAVTITNWVVEACYDVPASIGCSPDIMQSLLNSPAFRIDAGIAYLTQIIFATDGQMRLVTISRPV